MGGEGVQIWGVKVYRYGGRRCTDMGNTASKSVQIFLEFVHLWSYASTQPPYTRRCRVDRHTRSGQTQCGDPDTEQHYPAATQSVERAPSQCLRRTADPGNASGESRGVDGEAGVQ